MDPDEYLRKIMSLATATSTGTALMAISNQYAAISAANTERYLAAARNAESLATVELATTAAAVRRILGLVPAVKRQPSRHQIDTARVSVTETIGSPPVVT